MTSLLTTSAIVISLIMSSAHLAFAAEGHAQNERGSQNQTAQTALDLRLNLRTLWEDHVVYTRSFIVSAIGGLDDLEAVTLRLLKNQEDIGAAVETYFGEKAGKDLASLLKQHILIAAEIISAAKLGYSQDLNALQKKWGTNADDLAQLLAQINAHWSQQDLQKMLHQHLDFVTGQVTSRLKKDWAGDIQSYDQGHHHMLMFSDLLALGIAQKFGL